MVLPTLGYLTFGLRPTLALKGGDAPLFGVQMDMSRWVQLLYLTDQFLPVLVRRPVGQVP